MKQAANTEHRKRLTPPDEEAPESCQTTMVKHANELVQLCEGSERCDARTRLEAQVSTLYVLHVSAAGVSGPLYCNKYTQSEIKVKITKNICLHMTCLRRCKINLFLLNEFW